MKVLMGEDYNEFTGMTTRYFYEDSPSGGKIHMQVLQDVEPALVQNQKEFNQYNGKSKNHLREGGLGTKVASIPPGLIEKLMKDGFNVYRCSDSDLRKLLNNPDYSKIRTAPGRV